MTTIHQIRKLPLLGLASLLIGHAMAVKADGGGSYGPYSKTPLNNREGKAVGTALLYGGVGIHAVVVLHQLPPGEYAVTLHAGKTCSGPDFSSAGDFLTLAKKQRKPTDMAQWSASAYPVRLNVHADGRARKELDIPYVQLWGQRNAAGHTLILSSITKPGIENRLACGVIAPAS